MKQLRLLAGSLLDADVLVFRDAGVEPFHGCLGLGQLVLEIRGHDLRHDLVRLHRLALNQFDRLDPAGIRHRDEVFLGEPRLAPLVDELANVPLFDRAACTVVPPVKE